MRYLFSITFFLFICWIIFEADTGSPNFFIDQVKGIPYGDKLGHFTLYGMLTFLVNISLKLHSTTLKGHTIQSGALLVGSFAILEEFTQILLHTRNFQLSDIVSDLVGIYCFSWLSIRFVQWSRSNFSWAK